MVRTVILSLIGAVLLGACALMQASTPPAPQNPRQALLLAVYETTAVVQAATDAERQGLIPAATLRAVLDRATETRAHLEVARVALAAGDVTSAQGQLALAQGVLSGLRLMLTGGAP